MERPLLNYYLNLLEYDNRPDFLDKYLQTDSMSRIKGITYLCGMDNASKDIYDFKEYITRYDHSLTVALLTWKCTHDKTQTIAGLFHDISTPCFSHVIDYMNKDYKNQESTEEYTERILKSDKKLLEYLKQDEIDIEDIINFKKYSIVDNRRPKICADRLDGLILTGISWTKNITFDDITNIMNDIKVYKNELNEEEIGFQSENIAKRVYEINKSIDTICHSSEDNYMMELLASITRNAINNRIVTYDELYNISEKELMERFETSNNKLIQSQLYTFKTITKDHIPSTNIENIKIRDLNPIINGKRMINKKF